MLSKIKSLITVKNDMASQILIMHREKRELRKIESPVRKEIRQTVKLSSEQKQEIDEFYIRNYGKKIPYYWHEYYTAYTGKFDVKYFPELLFIPEFEFYMNRNKEYADVLADKNFLPLIASFSNVIMPKTIISSTRGMLQDSKKNIISLEDAVRILSKTGEVFAKPSVDSGSGKGCRVLNIKNGKDVVSGESFFDIYKDLGADFAVQERLKCHKSISKINPYSVNTFRIITYRWRDQIKTMPAIMRIGTNKSFLDNAHAGGIFIAVDDDGRLHDTAFTEFNKKYNKHPDTDVVFSECVIENFAEVLESARTMHKCVPQIGVVNWDFTINSEGNPVLIEANTEGGSIWLIEMAHGRGGFLEDTAEVLQWLHKMNNTFDKRRKDYCFGVME